MVQTPGMRYEMRKLGNGWAVWDTVSNTPANVGGCWQTDLDMKVADDLTDLLNGMERTSHSAELLPEEDLGGGDICSLEQEPSTDDDKPLG